MIKIFIKIVLNKYDIEILLNICFYRISLAKTFILNCIKESDNE